MNNVVIKGRLDSDPEMEITNSGKKVCRIQVAVHRRFQKEDADFFQVVAWKRKGELIYNYFRKGQEILIRGVMQSSHYEQDGIRRVQWKLVAEDIEFCGSRIETKPSEVSSPQAEEKPDNHITQEEIVKYNRIPCMNQWKATIFPFSGIDFP